MPRMSNTEHMEQDGPWNEPLDELERELMDSDYWDESTTVVGAPVPNPTLTIGIRLERDEVRILSAAAQTADVPLSRYILQAALKAAKRPRKVPPGHHRSEGAA
jgi:hypothetical protein